MSITEKIFLNLSSYYIPNWSTFDLNKKQIIIRDILWPGSCNIDTEILIKVCTFCHQQGLQLFLYPINIR